MEGFAFSIGSSNEAEESFLGNVEDNGIFAVQQDAPSEQVKDSLSSIAAAQDKEAAPASSDSFQVQMPD